MHIMFVILSLSPLQKYVLISPRFMLLEPAQNANFKHRVSVSAPFARKLLSTLDVTPQFTGLLLGEPDYGAPGDFANHDQDGNVQGIGRVNPIYTLFNVQVDLSQNFVASNPAGPSTKRVHRGVST
jgi:hypothetical protein